MNVDVLGLGVVAVDDILSVPAYPPADVKVPVLAQERQCGGLTATALVAAARFGARCAYAGRLGEEDQSDFVLATLEREGIDTSLALRCPEAAAVHAVIIVDQGTGTRNIFFHVPGVTGAAPDWPSAAVISGAKVLFVDPAGAEGMVRAAGIAREAGVPVVADLEGSGFELFEELMALIDHLVIPQAFAEALTGFTEPETACAELGGSGRQAVVVTCGSAGAWYAGPDGAARHQPAFPVQAVDTTGCGDVFHGVYAATLAEGLDLPTRVRLASAAAALKATRPGGQSGIPTRPAIDAFLEGNQS